ncbi:unnamed protein product [Effrenium voratum]|uniref:Uncharacterized protein n=1 Tax=Effrenium voratum TaxID=2562239 RepID=A0AA36HNA2_9DINO|nr:unnamed protein product [Effrenium voratum]
MAREQRAFYEHLAGLTREYERVVQEQADLRNLLFDASQAAYAAVGSPSLKGVKGLNGGTQELIRKPDAVFCAGCTKDAAEYEVSQEPTVLQIVTQEDRELALNHRSEGPKAYELDVTMWKARGLRNADIVSGVSDPYCECSIEGRGRSTFRTSVANDDLNPSWDVGAVISDFYSGDALVFSVWDKDLFDNSDSLGKAVLPAAKILPDGFDGWLLLEGAGSTAGLTQDVPMIHVTAKVLRSFPEDQVRYREPEPMPKLSTTEPRLTWQEALNNESFPASPQDQEPKQTKWQKLQKFLLSDKYELILALFLCLNVASMAAELQYDGLELGYRLQYGTYLRPAADRWAWGNEILRIIDYAFSVIFTIDVVVRIAVLRSLFWRGGITNYIDVIVVVGSWLVFFASFIPFKPTLLRLLRFGKLVRALKVVRLSESLESLAFLMSCLRASGVILWWTMCLLVCIQGIAALFVSNLLHIQIASEEGQADTISVESRRAVFRYYGTFSASFLTMFEVLFANWAPACRVLTDHISEWWSSFFLLYRCILGFALLNVVNAVFVQSTLKVAHADEELQFAAKLKAQEKVTNKLQDMFKALDSSGDGVVTMDEFNEMIESPKLRFWASQLELESADLVSLFHLLDDGDGVISLNEFLEGASRLRGPAKNIDMARLLGHSNKIERQLKALAKALPARPPIHSGQLWDVRSEVRSEVKSLDQAWSGGV